MQDCKGVTTPMEDNRKLLSDQSKSLTQLDQTNYRSITGSLNYLRNTSRPDINYAVNQLSRHMTNPNESNKIQVKRVLRYLQETKDLKLIYSKSENQLQTLCDASWADDIQDRKSTSGCVMILSNGAIHWVTRKQEITANSTQESEYLSLAMSVNEYRSIKNVLMEIHEEKNVTNPGIMHCDNQAAMKLASSTINKSRHIDLKYHVVKEAVENEEIRLQYIESSRNVADGLTKPLSTIKLNSLIKSLGMN